MATLDDVKREFKALLGQKEDTQIFQLAKTGDGTGADTSDVSGEPGWAWVRLAADQSKVIKVYSLVRGLPPELPVIVGKPYPSAEYQQIIVTVHPVYHRKLTEDQIDQYTSVRHGESHSEKGYDRVPVGLRNLEPARLRQTDPESLSVYVENFRFVYGSILYTWPGGEIDLTASVPAGVGHRYVLVYLDPSTNMLGSTDGAISPLPVSPDLPVVTMGTIPLAVIDLEQGETAIGETDIYDYRQLWSAVGGVGDHTHSGIGDGGASLLCIEEFFVEDLPIVMTGNSFTPWGFYQTLYVSGLYESGDAELVTIHPDPTYMGTCPQMILIRPGPFGLYDTYSIRVRHGVGNIWLSGEDDVMLDDQTDHLLLIYNGQYWCDIGGHISIEASDITKTVGVDKDFATIQSAVDWFKGRIITGTCIINVDMGTYDEAVVFEDLFAANIGTLTLRGDTRVLAGLSFVDGAAINQAALANGGSGTGALANAGNNITVAGTVTNPDFDADGWDNGDKVLIYDNADTQAEYTIDSVLNNVITLTVAAPAVGNDATSICLLPDRRIERTTAGRCISATGVIGVKIDGFYIETNTGTSCDGIYVEKESSIEIENVAIEAEDYGLYADFNGHISGDGGAVSVWGCAVGILTDRSSDVNCQYVVGVANIYGVYVGTFTAIVVHYCVFVNGTYGIFAEGHSLIYCNYGTVRQCTTGYYVKYHAFVNAGATDANNNGNGTDYNPAPAIPGSAQGNHYGTIYAS